MSAWAQPNHPARLFGLFAATAAACGVIALAAATLFYLVDDIRARDDAPAAAPRVLSEGDIEVVVPIENAQQFKDLTGFAPFVPARVPANTDTTPKYFVSQPDEQGRRTGRVAFTQRSGVDVDGITGPIIVLLQRPLTDADAPAATLKRITAGNGRAIVAEVGCGAALLELQLFFNPDPAPGEEPVTPYMRTTAEGFLASVQEQCARQ